MLRISSLWNVRRLERAVALSVCPCSALAATRLCGVEGQAEMPARCVWEPGWQGGAWLQAARPRGQTGTRVSFWAISWQLFIGRLCSVGCFCVAGIIMFTLLHVVNTFPIYLLPKKKKSSFAKKKKKRKPVSSTSRVGVGVKSVHMQI